mgnify:CR=1 FL=1
MPDTPQHNIDPHAQTLEERLDTMRQYHKELYLGQYTIAQEPPEFDDSSAPYKPVDEPTLRKRLHALIDNAQFTLDILDGNTPEGYTPPPKGEERAHHSDNAHLNAAYFNAKEQRANTIHTECSNTYFGGNRVDDTEVFSPLWDIVCEAFSAPYAYYYPDIIAHKRSEAYVRFHTELGEKYNITHPAYREVPWSPLDPIRDVDEEDIDTVDGILDKLSATAQDLDTIHELFHKYAGYYYIDDLKIAQTFVESFIGTVHYFFHPEERITDDDDNDA